MSSSITTSASIEIEHIKIESARSIDEVRLALEAIVPQWNTIAPAPRPSTEGVGDPRHNGPAPGLFLTRGDARRLTIYGRASNAYRYEIGSPITTASLTQCRLAASLYVPLHVALYEDDRGLGVFEYDRLSSLFGQFEDERVTKVARELDESIEDTLVRAAG